MQVKYTTLERQEDGSLQGKELILTIDPISMDFKTGVVRGTVLDAGMYHGKLIDAMPVVELIKL